MVKLPDILHSNQLIIFHLLIFKCNLNCTLFFFAILEEKAKDGDFIEDFPALAFCYTKFWPRLMDF